MRQHPFFADDEFIFVRSLETDFISHTETTEIHRKDYANETHFLQMTSLYLFEALLKATSKRA